MILYKTDEFGNIITKKAQLDPFGSYVYDGRVWSPHLPESQPGKISVCLNGKWEFKDDNTGKWYDKSTGKEITNERYNPNFNAELHTKKKPSVDYPKWDRDKWIEDVAKKQKAENDAKIARDEEKIRREMRRIAIQNIQGRLEVVTE